MKGYIYYIKNNETGKQYIGATTNLRRRIRQHLCSTRYTNKWHKLLHEFPENFTIGVYETVESDNFIELNNILADREIYYYNKCKTNAGVYNMVKPSAAVTRGSKYTDERVTKQRNAHYGIPHKSTAKQHLITKFMNNLSNE